MRLENGQCSTEVNRLKHVAWFNRMIEEQKKRIEAIPIPENPPPPKELTPEEWLVERYEMENHFKLGSKNINHVLSEYKCY